MLVHGSWFMVHGSMFFRILAILGLLCFLFVSTPVQGAILQRAQALPDKIAGDPQRQPIPVSSSDPEVSDPEVSGPEVVEVSTLQEEGHLLQLGMMLRSLDGHEIRVDAIDADGAPLAAVPTAAMTVDGSNVYVMTTLAVPSGPELNVSSSYLRVVALHRETGAELLRLYYSCEKTWEVPSVVLRADPIGEAVALVSWLNRQARLEDLTPTVEAVVGEALNSERIRYPHGILNRPRALVEPQRTARRALEEQGLRELRRGITVENIRGQLLESPEPQGQPGLAGITERSAAAILPLYTPLMEVDTSNLQIRSEPVVPLSEARAAEVLSRSGDSQASRSTGRFVFDRKLVIQNESSVNMSQLNHDVLVKLPQSHIDLRTTLDHIFTDPQPQNEDESESAEPTHLVEMSGPAIFSLVHSEPTVDVDLHRVLGIESTILPDRNEVSGIYYYIPNAYRLAFNSSLGGSRGLALRIDYDRVSAPGADQNAVRVAMTLETPLDANGLAIVDTLMRAYDEQSDVVRFTELRPLPLASVPSFEFESNLAGMVDPENIAVTAFSDFLEGLVVTWRTDPVRAERIRRDLASELAGITGTARFPLPSDGQQLVREVPVQVRLSDPEVFKAVRFNRSGSLENVSPVPIRLKYLHALILDPPEGPDTDAAEGPRIYSWSLGDTTMSAGGEATLDLVDFPSTLDSMADRIWIDYGLDPTCEGCLGPVVEALLNGGIWPDTETIEILALDSLFAGLPPPFAESGNKIAEIEVQVRSRFFEPADRTLRQAPPLYLTPEVTEHSVGPLFPDDSADAPLYEYLLSVRYCSGRFLEGQNWISEDRTRLRPGQVQLEQSLGITAPGE